MTKKLLLSIALVGLVTDVQSQTPFHISQLGLMTVDCQSLTLTTTFDFTVAGGTAPYTLSATNVNEPNQTSTDGNFNLITQSDLTDPVVATIVDATGKQIVRTFAFEPSLFSVATILTACPGTLSYSIDLRGVGTDVRATLSRAGFSESQTGVSGAFVELQPGNYTLTLTPTDTIPPNCNISLEIPITIAALPFAVTPRNTSLSNDSNNGELTVNVIAGIPPFTFTLNGPTTQVVGPQGNRQAIFTNLVGGFYTITVSDSNPLITGGCDITVPAVVNFFSNPVANRIALGYCQ